MWALKTAFDLGPFALALLVSDDAGAANQALQLGMALRIYAAIGIPLALLFTIAVGLPVWSLRERRGNTTARDAVWAAISIALVYEAVIIASFVLGGLATASDPNTYYSSSDFGVQMVEDGLWTPAGWLFKGVDMAWTTLAAAIAGLTGYRFGRFCDRAYERRQA